MFDKPTWLILIISYSLRMVERHYLASKHQCSVLDIVDCWSLIFGIINVITGCILLFQTIHNGVSYIPPKDDVFTIKIPSLFRDSLHTFSITVEHLYNKLEKWKFGITLFALAIVWLASILLLIYDFTLFFHII